LSLVVDDKGALIYKSTCEAILAAYSSLKPYFIETSLPPLMLITLLFEYRFCASSLFLTNLREGPGYEVLPMIEGHPFKLFCVKIWRRLVLPF